MSPLPHGSSIFSKLSLRAFSPGTASSAFRTQWQNPSDVFSVLLILGGDIIQQSLAQLVGSRLTPIAFSFGWVAYGVSAIRSSVGENWLMPTADCNCKVISGKSGYARDNVSWIIGRIMRDHETWMDDGKPDGPIHQHLEKMIDDAWKFQREQAAEAREKGEDVEEPVRPTQVGLCVSIYRAGDAKVGHPGYDASYFLGFATIIVQLGIAAIPCGLYGDYGQLLITSAGTALALATGSLKQWRTEKWHGRMKTKKNFILTRGNGAQHAIVILGAGKGLDLEDLSAVPHNVDVWTGTFTKAATIVLGLLWICLLISASGLGENKWYLLAIGGLGIVENIYVAGRARTPEAYGIPLQFVEVIGKPKVMDTLFDVEEQYPHVGRAMRDTFFPGDIFPKEAERWNKLKEDSKEREKVWNAQQEEAERLVKRTA